jgi:hypothetical protein
MVDAGAGAGEPRLCDILTVVDHQGQIDVSISHVPRNMPASISRGGLTKAEDILIKLGRLLQIISQRGLGRATARIDKHGNTTQHQLTQEF